MGPHHAQSVPPHPWEWDRDVSAPWFLETAPKSHQQSKGGNLARFWCAGTRGKMEKGQRRGTPKADGRNGAG